MGLDGHLRDAKVLLFVVLPFVMLFNFLMWKRMPAILGYA